MASIQAANHAAIDYDLLRREGIRHIQRLAAGRWTDHNTHDPGLTLLEALCYALSDLAYRTRYALPELIGAEQENRLRSAYGPEQMLPGAPLNLPDLRKYLLDLPDNTEARIEALEESNPRLFYHPYDSAIRLGTPITGAEAINIAGLYRVRVRIPDDNKAALETALKATRPLCGYWTEAAVMQPESIKINIDLEIAPEVSLPEQLAAQAFQAIATVLAAAPVFQPRAESLRAGTPVEDLYEGPLLQRGVLDGTRLPPKRNFLRASDLIHVLMDLPGVRAVRDVQMGDTKEHWLLPLNADQYPTLKEDSTITLYQGSVSQRFKKPTIIPKADEFFPVNAALAPVAGRDRRIGHYHSIRHHLPALYLLDTEHLPDDPRRRAPVKQLGAYLIFFEQLLADYLAQLEHARVLFDYTGEANHSYAVQVLKGVPGALPLLGKEEGADEAVFIQAFKATLQAWANPDSSNRLNRLQDHLLARFAESFTDYALLVGATNERVLRDKRAFLKDYPIFSRQRGTGFNLWQPDARSGLEHRIARQLGLPWPPPADPTDQTFFLVEHILLLPVPQDTTGADPDEYWLTEVPQADPYSRQLTYVFLADSARFPEANNKFETYKQFVELTLHRETPAHLVYNCLWLDKDAFTTFAAAYQAWRTALNNAEGLNNHAYRVARDRMLDLLVQKVTNTTSKFLIGWANPILDLDIEVPIVPPYVEGENIVIKNSQPGVIYSLLTRKGESIPDYKGKPAQGNGSSLMLLLPSLSKDTTFLVKAIKEIVLLDKPRIAEGFLRQKVRVRVGLDLKIPFEAIEKEIAFDKTAKIRLTRSQAQVIYWLVDDQDKVVSVDDIMGSQGNPIVLESVKLEEDTVLRVKARREFEKTVTEGFIEGSLTIRVRPNPTLPVKAEPLVVEYRQSAKVSVSGTQASAGYGFYFRRLADTEFIYTEMPAKWDKTTIANSIAPLIYPSNGGIPDGFNPVSKPLPLTAGNGGELSFDTPALEEDTRLLVFAKKVGHDQGVVLTESVAVLVMPNLKVKAELELTEIPAGSKAVVSIAPPQPGVRYTLLRKGGTGARASLYFHNTIVGDPGRDGVGVSRLEADFVVGEVIKPPLLLETPPLEADTELEVIAEKVHTGLAGVLQSTLFVKVTGTGKKQAETPPKKRAPRKPKS